MSEFDRRGFSMVLACALASGSAACAANFTSATKTAAHFGVHEFVLTGDGSVANPFDTIATVTLVPPSGWEHARTVQAFYDGGNTWRARVYTHEVGNWSWASTSAGDRVLDRQTGTFACADSTLRGRLLPHAKNRRQSATKDGRWFLNLSDTAYFLLCAHDGNGEPISDAQAMQYFRDHVSHGITSVRCFLASRQGGFSESSEQWITCG